MASRRSLASRQTGDAASSQVNNARQPTALPPYEPPSCPLTEKARRSLAKNTSGVDYRKYEKHLKAAVANITNCTGDINERLYVKKERVRKMAEKREATDPDAEKSTVEEEAEVQVREMEDKVKKITAKSEQALRDLIDYKAELAEQREMVDKVIEEVTANNIQQNRNANSAAAEHEDNGEEEDVISQAIILSPIELFKKAKADHDTKYKAQSMRVRYAENNDYKGFKRLLHDVQNPGENQPPMPNASTWFPAENGDHHSSSAAARRRRLATNTDNTENGDDDDEIQMTGVISSLKCPLTLQTFKEPYSNNVCKHTFEKSAILEYYHQNAIAYGNPSQAMRRGQQVPEGPKQIKCPERGCDAMLHLDDFFGDQMILRQVKRQAAQAAAEAEEEEEEMECDDDVIIPSTQRSVRPGLGGSFGGDSRGTRSQTLKQESQDLDGDDEDVTRGG